MNGGFQKITRCGKAKRASKLRTGGGIKAVITIGDLQSVVVAAKKWQERCVAEGVEASKLLHHIANAEAVLIKYRTRNKLKFERREEMRRERAESMGEEVPPPPPPTPSNEPRFGTIVWNALDALTRKGGGEPRNEVKQGKEAARPTRW